MTSWTALYYPDVEPPMKWLRSAALFFEEVRSFVPEDSDDQLSDQLRRFAEATSVWSPYRPTDGTALLANASIDMFDQAFARIAANRKIGPDAMKVEIQVDGGSVRVKDHVFMHGLKISPLVQECLSRFGDPLPNGNSQHPRHLRKP